MSDYCAEIKAAEKSLVRIRRFSRKAKLIFTFLFWLNVIVTCLFIALNYIAIQQSASSLLTFVIPPIAFFIVSSAILWFLADIFDEISKGYSPISLKQARRLRLLAMLLLVGVVIDLVVQIALPDYSSIMQTNLGIELGYIEPSGLSSLHIDVKTLVASVVCYCFSAIFSYGAYLQEVSDETV